MGGDICLRGECLPWVVHTSLDKETDTPPTATAADRMHPTGMHSCYRPQTKFAKVMFLQVSVCPRGGACMVAGGACVVAAGGCVVAGVHVWLLGDMRGCQGHAWQRGYA